MLPPEQSQHAHYRGTLGRNVVTIATLLQDAGYHTYVAGKWHLGMTHDLLPSRRGFERTIILADSGADNWEQKAYLPIYDKANWFADGNEAKLPEDFYSSRFLIDKTIEFIESNKDDGRPFFAYVPFQAVHIPVQAPQEFIDRYMGVYDEGWDRLRYERRLRAARLGIIPEGAGMVAMSTTGDWFALTPEEKRYQAKRMTVYAAMVEAMDFHMGRLVEHLKRKGLYENTIFIFTSDNGSEASGPANPESPITRFALGQRGYSTDYDTLGLKGSFNSIGPAFASAAASPLAYYKFYTGEGGLRVPLIIAGTPLRSARSMTHAFTWVTDIAPTILELTGTKPPGKRYGGRVVDPMISARRPGRSRLRGAGTRRLRARRKCGLVRGRLQDRDESGTGRRREVAPLRHCKRPGRNDGPRGHSARSAATNALGLSRLREAERRPAGPARVRRATTSRDQRIAQAGRATDAGRHLVDADVAPLLSVQSPAKGLTSCREDTDDEMARSNPAFRRGPVPGRLLAVVLLGPSTAHDRPGHTGGRRQHHRLL
jgi:arylsulfatase A-like enzyme